MEKLNVAAVLEEAKAAREAGFTAAAVVLEAKASRARKLAIAYEHYRSIPIEAVKAFQDKLRLTTERPASDFDLAKMRNERGFHHATTVCDQLVFCPMEAYPGLPPGDVFEKVKEARTRECFDGYEIAEIQPVATQIKLPDPIVFGLIEGCSDRFFVAEWGTDVSINDLIAKHEG